MKIIAQGAEAKLYFDRKKIIKDRIKKNYRIEQLDEKLRKTRTKQEANLITVARRAGVPTPFLYEIDKNKIIMEYIQGKTIKEIFQKSDENKIKKLSIEIGQLIGKLHSNGIIHGDLTTSNMILRDNKIYFIDFGLGYFSQKIEDQGTDLRLLYNALKSTHFKILNISWNNIIQGYRKEYKHAEKVLKKVKEIESRTRYAKK
ncbi:MAG: Kae1-associated serine/threonine protein kinase [Candidatus Aenigmarchaeota archaeon]|nr:Kae1-associated serine/threonine protein kinase [Candidatus Aenigmarchaeota archaeon]